MTKLLTKFEKNIKKKYKFRKTKEETIKLAHTKIVDFLSIIFNQN